MKTNLSIYPIFLFILTTVVFSSCSHTDEINVYNSDFNVSSETVYLDEPITLIAKETAAEASYRWNFGDGTSANDEHSVTHRYSKPGNYTTSLSVNGLIQSKAIKVLPGQFSYQVANKSNTYLDILVYINNYENGCVKRMDISKGAETDTIYVDSPTRFSELYLFGISIFVENSEYTFADVKFLKEFQHQTITITDSTRLLPRTSHGWPSVVLLKDLY